MDVVAMTKICELEEQIEYLQTVIDLLHEDIADRDTEIRVLKGQLWNLHNDRNYSIGVSA